MQLEDSPTRESMAWLRILENILVAADTSKLTRATGHQWHSTLCRCISSLLRNKGDSRAFSSRVDRLYGFLSGKEPTILHQCALVVLRLSLIPDIPGHTLLGVLCRTAEDLRRSESSIELHRLPLTRDCLQPQPLPPHRAQGLHDIPAAVESLWMWGQIVETLWRAAMSLDKGTPVWGMLTRRLIVWRALIGEDGSQVGEWARKEAVRALHAC
ncbi:hypothetical protein JVU11DRAFT_2662 [Chiua virens]|nr:hypothetical protein JVU11DRAFT_2662 [Chiua virens]